MSKPLQPGDPAPKFSLPDQHGKTFRMEDALGKKVQVIFFYPKDNTRVCTKEACSFRDHYEIFHEAGAEVIGISSDSVKSHSGFANRHQLPFVLLSDSGGKVRKQFGVKGALLGLVPGRTTYIIDRKGIIRHVIESMMDHQLHVDGALAMIKELKQENPA